MGQRDPLHQSGLGRRELASRIGALSSPRLPAQLLPFERQLIDELGCTEAEYRNFKDQIYWLARERPAEYAHIPEVQNEVGTIALVLTLVGLVFQGVSYLLTPKPDLGRQREITNRNLDNIAGRDRFAPTYGFQTAQELSRYGELIPLVFTKQKQVQLNIGGDTATYYVGGVMISPKLVWSRMFSWGGYQSLEMVFLVGHSPMTRGPYSTPEQIAEDRAGVYIGQLPLDSFNEQDYRWYYHQGAIPNAGRNDYTNAFGSIRPTTSSRLLGQDNRYGNFWISDEQNRNAFKAQSFAGLTGEAFCHAFSPTSQTRFGVYNALPNGTPYRLNFEVISIPDALGESGKKSAVAKRFQIAGNPFLDGTGRNYARQFGIVAYNGAEYSAPNTNNGTIIKGVQIGHTITVIYNANKIQETLYYNTNHPNLADRITSQLTFLYPSEDTVDNKQIITNIQTEHEQQDELLQIGTKWLVGNCLFEVDRRTPDDSVFDKTDSREYSVVLRCIAVYADGGTGTIGVCDRGFLTISTNLPEGNNGPIYDIDQAWFPLCKAELAVVQNTRRCEVTEIGIKSNVWARFNGICNFNSVPSPAKLNELDYRDVNLTTGTIQTYARRASFFHLYVRPANNSYKPEEGWAKLNPFPFCVVGSSPQDQYNFIRIAQPYDQFEYRLRPITSGELVQIIGKFTQVNVDGTVVKGPCIRLKSDGTRNVATVQNYRNSNIVTPYGIFTLFTRGFVDSIADLAQHAEMFSDPSVPSNPQPGITVQPTGVRFVRAVMQDTGADATLREISNGITRAIGKDPDPIATEIPNIPYAGVRVGSDYVFNNADANNFEYSDGTKSVRLRLRLRVERLGPLNATAKRTIFWTLINPDQINANFDIANNWRVGEQFTITSQLLPQQAGVLPRYIDYIFETTGPDSTANKTELFTGARLFEANSGIAEVSHYGNLISRSCDNGPEHEVTYINENLANDPVRNGTASYTGCAMAGIKIRSSINISQFEQLHIYQKSGIAVTNLRQLPDGSAVETFEASNIFTDLAYYLLTSVHTGAGELISADLIDKQQFARTGSFLEANNLYYDDVIVEPQNLREFLSRISTSLLCNLVMRGGKFSIEPALPVDENRNYAFYDVKVPVKGIFTEGNIIENSFQLEYVQTSERLPIRALVRYRTELPNRFPQEQTVVIYYNDQPNGPIEEFNFTHITSRYHAELFAKYALSARRHRTHGVTFKTLPYGLGLAPGDFIRVVTQTGYASPAGTGIIKNDGAMVTSQTFTDGQVLNVYYWDRTNNAVNEGQITVTLRNGQPFASQLFDSIFSVKSTTTNDLVYMVDSIQLDEEGMVEITASYFPVDVNNHSVIANELKPDYTGFTVVADLAPD